MGFVADDGDRLVVTLGAQGGRGLESALSTANDDDAHLAILRLLLRRGRVDHQAVECQRYVELAAQTAIGLPGRRSGFEHRILVFRHRLQNREELLFDVDVAGGALAVATAFSDDAVDAVLDGAFHDGVAYRNVNGAGSAGI